MLTLEVKKVMLILYKLILFFAEFKCYMMN